MAFLCLESEIQGSTVEDRPGDSRPCDPLLHPHPPLLCSLVTLAAEWARPAGLSTNDLGCY